MPKIPFCIAAYLITMKTRVFGGDIYNNSILSETQTSIIVTLYSLLIDFQ